MTEDSGFVKVGEILTVSQRSGFRRRLLSSIRNDNGSAISTHSLKLNYVGSEGTFDIDPSIEEYPELGPGTRHCGLLFRRTAKLMPASDLVWHGGPYTSWMQDAKI